MSFVDYMIFVCFAGVLVGAFFLAFLGMFYVIDCVLDGGLRRWIENFLSGEYDGKNRNAH